MRDISKVLERAGLPLVTVTYAITVALQFRDALDKLGWRVLSVTVLLACVAWLVYICTAKRPNTIDPSELQSVYGWATRMAAIAAVLAAIIPATYAILPSGPRVPFLLFKAVNNTPNQIEISPYAETYFTVVGSPAMESLIESGRMRLYTGDPKRETLSIPSHAAAYLIGRFLNDSALVPLLDREDVGLAVILTTFDGRSLRRGGIPFNRKDLKSGYIELQFN